ncbi:MAG: hypothetical protein U9Q24_04225 [Candidatus Ratteibacteria bacterium]|nr:hypothetical protein [Candidatus Ratteibacteria bacterium]
MKKNRKLMKINIPSDLFEIIKDPERLAQFLTGFLSSNMSEKILSTGRVVQAAINWDALSQLGKEMNDYIEKGKIKKDFLSKSYNQQSLLNLLQFIDENSPDEERLKAMKTLFFKSVFVDVNETDQILAYHFMRICRELSSGDLLILKAAFEIYNGKISKKVCPDPSTFDKNLTSADNWLISIANQTGHGLKSLVENHEDKLINLKLISPRKHSDKSGIAKAKYFRLTDLGYKICEFIYKENTL